jgi:hypothetical protein
MLNINPHGVGIDNAFDFAKIANLESIKRFLDGLSANDHLKSFFMVGNYQDEPRGTNKVPATEHSFQCVCINKWDYERNCRSQYISPTEQTKLLGVVFQKLLLYALFNSGAEEFVGRVLEEWLKNANMQVEQEEPVKEPDPPVGTGKVIKFIKD